MTTTQSLPLNRDSVVREVWQRVLHVDYVDPSASFFELGGDSLAALQLVEAIQRELGYSTDIGTLFRRPTFRQFVDGLSVPSNETAEPELRRFFQVNKSHDKPPLFCIAHAPFIDADRPVYTYSGLYDRIHSLDDLLHPDELAATVQECLEDILQVQAAGPFYLSGYCHGGWLMVALAQRLRQRGEKVAYLGLIETMPRLEWYSGAARRLLSPNSIRQLLSERFYRLASKSYQRRGWGYVAAAAVANGLLPRSGWTFRQRVAHFHNVQTYRDFEQNVFEKGLDVPVHLFVTQASLQTETNIRLVHQWQRMVAGDVVVHPISADHHSIRRHDNLQVIAGQVSGILEQLERGTSVSTCSSASLGIPKNTKIQVGPNSEFFSAILSNRNLIYHDIESGEASTAAEMIDRYRAVRQATKQLAFVYMDNSLPSIAALWGFLFHGYAVVLLNHKLNPALKSTLEEHYSPLVIHDPGRKCPPLYEEWRLDSGATCFRRNRVENLQSPIADQVDVLMTTSGTTGSPKLVKLSQANLLHNARSIATYLPIQSNDVAPLNLPVDYSYGLSVLTSNSIQGGQVLCSVRNAMDPEFWKDFQRLGMTTLAGTPDFYHIIRKLGILHRELPSLRYLTQAGGALDVESTRLLANWATSQHKKFFVMYGQTEATARMSYLPPEMVCDHAGSIGQPIPGGEFEIDPENGELLYRGPNIFGGYAESLADLATYDSPSVLRTGDIARRNDQGQYFITGRLKRFVKVLGVRVSLDEIERVLTTEFAASRFACLRGTGEQIHVIQESFRSDDDAVRDLLHRRLRIPPSVVEFHCFSSLPMTPNGKTDYQILAERTNTPLKS